MGLTLLSILEIAGNYPSNIVATSGGPSLENGKYVGWITLGESHRYRPIFSTEAIYDTPEQAKEAMQKVVSDCLKLADETMKDESNPLVQFLSSEDGQAVRTIVDMAKNGIPE
jgi:hypothetical protein